MFSVANKKDALRAVSLTEHKKRASAGAWTTWRRRHCKSLINESFQRIAHEQGEPDKASTAFNAGRAKGVAGAMEECRISTCAATECADSFLFANS